MTERELNKPFYSQPPWNILFDFQKLERVNPWEISISFLLFSFLEEMERREEIDFRASGVALDSSATIYLMKSNLLLKLEEPPASPEPKPDFIPPPLILPLRYELTTTTIRHLLKALDDALRGEKIFTMKPTLEHILPPPPEVIPVISPYLMEIEEQMDRLLQKMRYLVDNGEVVTFSKLISGLERLEQVRTFIILLFMAQKERVTLWQQQEEAFGEIIITLNGDLAVGE